MRGTAARRVWRLLLASVFLLLGIAGAILPIIPGSPFLLIGLIILADDFPWARRFTNWAFQKLERYEGCRSLIEKHRAKAAMRDPA